MKLFIHFSVVAFSLLFSISIYAIDENQKLLITHTYNQGGFSFQTPIGWSKNYVLTNMMGAQYPIVTGNSPNNASANIMVEDELFYGDLTSYANMGISNAKSAVPNLKIISRKKFITISGLQGIQLQAENTMQFKKIRQDQYYFSGKNNKKFVVTCTHSLSANDSMSALYQKIMKTFKLH